MKKRILISIIFVLIISYVLIFLVDLSHKKYVIIGTNNSTVVYYNNKILERLPIEADEDVKEYGKQQSGTPSKVYG